MDTSNEVQRILSHIETEVARGAIIHNTSLSLTADLGVSDENLEEVAKAFSQPQKGSAKPKSLILHDYEVTASFDEWVTFMFIVNVETALQLLTKPLEDLITLFIRSTDDERLDVKGVQLEAADALSFKNYSLKKEDVISVDRALAAWAKEKFPTLSFCGIRRTEVKGYTVHLSLEFNTPTAH